MKWIEIINEKMSFEQKVQSYAMDLLIPLYKKKLPSVSFKQFKSKMEQNPDITKLMDIDDDFYMDQLTKLSFVDKVEPDEDTDVMMIWFKSKEPYPHASGEDDAEKKKDHLEKNATDQAKKNVKGDNPLI